MLFVDIPHRVAQNHGVAVAILVILLYEFLLVGLPTLWSVLLCLEERAEFARLMCLGKSTLLE